MRLCLLRSSVSIHEFRRDGHHRRHRHISKEDGEILLKRGFATWLDEARGVLQLVGASRFALRGASTRYGSFLAAAIQRREAWALILRSEVRGWKEC